MPYRMSRILAIAMLSVWGLSGNPSRAAVPTVINVEIDYMVLRDAGNNILHTHRPTSAEINAGIQMFACQGIDLNVIIDDEIPDVLMFPQNPNNPKTIFGWTGTNSFDSFKSSYFNHSGGGWHYCIFGHQYQLNGAITGSSGLAEGSADDLVVTLGSFSNSVGTPWDRAGTFVHELGHNLGLSHSGSMEYFLKRNELPTIPNSNITPPRIRYKLAAVTVRNEVGGYSGKELVPSMRICVRWSRG